MNFPINKNVTITGPARTSSRLTEPSVTGVPDSSVPQSATISDLTIRNGQTGIWNDGGTLTVSNCAVSGNSEGGLFNGGVLTVSNCDVSGNLYGIYNSQYVLTVIHCDIGNSYGIYNYYGEASVSSCIVSSNQYGGVFNYGVSGGPNDQILSGLLAIADSIINDNSGPGVDNNAGGVQIVDTTITGNSVGRTGGQSDVGGGVYTYQYGGKIPGNLIVMNSTISGNFASSAGGGIACGKSGLTIINSTISGNSAGAYGGGIVGASSRRYDDCQQHGERQLSLLLAAASPVEEGFEIGNTILNANGVGKTSMALSPRMVTTSAVTTPAAF